MGKKKQINIACACDDRYSQHTGVMLCSLFENCSDPKKVHVYLLDGGISEENKKNLKIIVENKGGKIYFKEPSFEKIANFDKINFGRYGKIAYSRIYLPKILEGLNKIIWIDSDFIIKEDIQEINDIELRKSLGAVSEGTLIHKKHKVKLGLKKEKEYFNSGFLIIDLKRFREKRYSEKISGFSIEKRDIVKYPDQDGLNVCLKDDWQRISLKWNVFTMMYRPGFPETFLRFSKEKAKNIRENPKAIHYTTHKPWDYSSYHPKKKEYWIYLKKTPWKNYKYPDKNIKEFIKKIKNIIIFYLPARLLREIKKIKRDW